MCVLCLESKRILEVDVRCYVSRHQCQEMSYDHQSGCFGGRGILGYLLKLVPFRRALVGELAGVTSLGDSLWNWRKSAPSLSLCRKPRVSACSCGANAFSLGKLQSRLWVKT